MRLIDADKLRLCLKNYAVGESPSNAESADDRKFSRVVYKALTDCVGIVDKQPTAFDLDKVVGQLEKEESKARLELMEDRKTAFEFSSKSRLDAYKKAVDIVKEGGVR